MLDQSEINKMDTKDLSDEIENIAKTFHVHINDMPYDILLKIFSFLSLEDRVLDACLVCKMWHNLCFDGSFWKHVDFEDRRRLDDETFLRSLKYSDNVLSINLDGCLSESLTKQGIVEASKLCPNLKSFNLKNSISDYIKDDVMIEICRYCPNLECINVHSQSLTNDAAINGIAKYLKNLKSLNITQNTKVDDEGMIAIIDNCPKLQNLRVGLNRLVTDKFIKALAKKEKESPLMEALCVSLTGVTGKGTGNLQYFKNLVYLDITKCVNIEFDDVWAIVTNATKLQHFFCAMQDRFDDRCAEITVTHLTELIELYLGSTTISDVAMEHISIHSRKLEWLDVPYTNVTEKGIQMVCEKVPKLCHLGLTRTDKADVNEVEILAHRFSKIYFKTLLQETKRMLVRSGEWFEEDPGPLTEKIVFDRLRETENCVRTKPRRVIGSGGIIEYVPYELPHRGGVSN